MGEFLGAVAFMWPIHLMAGLVSCIPVWLLTRARTSWGREDLWLFVVPWAVLMVFVMFGGRDLSLTSLLVQNVVLGLALVLGLVAKLLMLSWRVSGVWQRSLQLAVPSAIGVMLWAFVPFLGE